MKIKLFHFLQKHVLCQRKRKINKNNLRDRIRSNRREDAKARREGEGVVESAKTDV